MSAVTKKPLTATPDSRRSLKDSSAASPSRSPVRPPSATSTPLTMSNSVARNRSARVAALVAARGGTQRSSAGAGASNINSGTAWSENEDDARAENIALIDDLKERLRKGEEISEQFQKQAQVLQSRLDEAIAEQEKLEERIHESDERILRLENEKRDFLRQQRETEASHEAEKKLMAKEREESVNREEEMKVIIQRLKDSLNSRTNGIEEAQIPRRPSNPSSNFENSQFVPPSNLEQSDSRTNSKLLLQKDRLIESLRLEIAEAQIKLVESENMGGDRLQVAEKELLQARMTNARLMEDNESYQLLLSERTLTGDFSKSEFMGSAIHNADALNALEGRPRQPSLADELSEAGETQSDSPRGLAAELKLCKDQNKALTLYINKIIERLLQHQDFEAILDKSPGAKAGIGPSDRDSMPSPKEASGVSVLQRAKTVAMGNTRRPRPQSYMAASTHSVVSDQETAPSIPIGVNRASSYRSGRPNSEQFGHGAANVVNQMYRSGHHSPSLHGPQTPQSFFSPPLAGNPNAVHRAPSAGQVPATGSFSGVRSESSSINSDSGEVITPPSNSPPRSEKATTFAGNKPRQLRLLRDGNSDSARRPEEETTTRSAKRTSWMGWAFGGKKEEGPESIQE
ncbi:hypothetical protein K3495_g8370 [Podosphaera aphanis]|nr:hypothetical protein K3495_g8370 [Podosphaera aphanis]